MKRTSLLISAAFCLILGGAVIAQDNSADLFADSPSVATDAASDEASPVDAGSAFTLKFSGSHEAGYHAPVMGNDRNYDGSMKSPALRNDLGVEVQDGAIKLVSHWAFDLMPTGTADPSNNGQIAGWNSLTNVRPLENYISWSPVGFKFAAGYQIYSWGVADKRNPTDNLNPRDFTVGANADKIPVLSADAIWYPTDSLSLEGVYIPYEQTDLWPADFRDGVESGLKVINAGLAAKGVPSALWGTESASYDALSYSPSSAVGGGKISYRSAAADLSVSYLYDFDQFYTPVMTVKYTSPVTPYVIDSVSLERKRIHRFGGDAKTTVGKFGLWLEGAYSLTENDGSDDYSVRKSKIDYTTGFDVNYGPNDSYYVNFQLIGSWIPGFEKDAQEALVTTKTGAQNYYESLMVNSLGFDTQGYLQGATMNLKWNLMDSFLTPQVTAVCMVPFNYDDSVKTRLASLALNPELDLMPVDSFHIKIGADLYYAWIKEDGDVKLDQSTDMIGLYTPSNNVYVKIAYKWNYDLKK